MQLFALDENGNPIAASAALKQCNYSCMECRSVVRLRSGLHRRKHFYHTNAISSCRLNGKSLTHLQIQCRIQNLFPKEDCTMERSFPEIHRIADVVWEPKKIIFEIQCSPITRGEVLQRNKDYGSLGYTVVWILHDKQFNRWRVSGAELALMHSPFYYTNVNQEGEGMIYDQLSIIIKGIRRTSLGPMPILLHRPFKITLSEQHPNFKLPAVLKHRMQTWPIAFEKDIVDACRKEGCKDFLAAALQEEKRLLPCLHATKFDRLKNIFRMLFYQPYRIIFQILLEKASR